jgi:hypothetical protein
MRHYSQRRQQTGFPNAHSWVEIVFYAVHPGRSEEQEHMATLADDDIPLALYILAVFFARL